MPRKRVLARAALFAAIAFAVTMALLPHPPELPIEEAGDKYQHMFAFSVLAALAAWSYPQASLLRIGERLSFLGALIEVLQAIPALHRDCDIFDWVADTAAITVILLLVASARRRTRAATW